MVASEAKEESESEVPAAVAESEQREALRKTGGVAGAGRGGARAPPRHPRIGLLRDTAQLHDVNLRAMPSSVSGWA